MKVCIHCKRELPETAFSKSKSSQDGLQGYCKECCAEYRKAKRNYENEKKENLKRKMFENNHKKLYIARDYSTYDENGEKIEGKLKIFYDTPLKTKVEEKIYWKSARLLGEIPNYMFSEIKEGECGEYILKKISK